MAVVCMVFYHFMWDMMFFGLYPHDVTSGGWRLFARSVAITFLVLVGVSMVLTARRKAPAERNRQWLERGAKVFGWGLLISVVTRIFLGEAFVLYGILHLIGTAFLLAPLLWRIRRWTPLLGAGFVAERSVDYARSLTLDPDTGEFTRLETRTLQPNSACGPYAGDVLVLSGPQVMSSSEAFLLMMREAGATLIGAPSFGSSGNPRPRELANGLVLYVPQW